MCGTTDTEVPHRVITGVYAAAFPCGVFFAPERSCAMGVGCERQRVSEPSLIRRYPASWCVVTVRVLGVEVRFAFGDTERCSFDFAQFFSCVLVPLRAAERQP